MPIGKHQTGMPQISSGEHIVKFLDFWPVDSDKLPTLASDGRQIRYHVTIMSGEDSGLQAPGSMDATEANLKQLVEAFGGDASKVSLDLEDVGTSLTLAASLMRKAAKTLKCKVGDKGWINSLEGMSTPDGVYIVSFRGFVSKDNLGNFSWIERESKFGKQKRVSGSFLIEDGPYKGRYLGFSVVYPFVVEEGIPAFAANKKDELLKNSKVWYNLMTTFGVNPDNFDVTAVSDVYNLVPEMGEEMTKQKIYATIVVENGWPDMNKLTPLPVGLALSSNKGTSEDALKILFEVITREVEKAGDGEAFDENGKLTEKGKNWSAINLKPVCKKLGIRASFEDMTADSVTAILNELGFKDDADKLNSF